MPTRQAVRDGITSSASVVTSAAVIMISIFVSFMFIDRIELNQVGVGLTVAVLVDAVVLRILILPAETAARRFASGSLCGEHQVSHSRQTVSSISAISGVPCLPWRLA